MMTKALLALADGSLFWGTSIGTTGSVVGEVIFNTSMTGYQEILTDPSYYQQIVTLTYPHIGNVGTNDEDVESAKVFAAGLVVRDNSIIASNFRSQKNLTSYLKKNGTVALANVDTRALTHILRDNGAQSACLTAEANIDPNVAIKKACEFAGLKGMDLAKEVSTEYQYHWSDKSWSLDSGYEEFDKFDFHVIVYDFGVKHNILRLLVDRGCQLTVVPATMSTSEVLAMEPDGVFLSNGPGDPEPCDYAQDAIKNLLEENIPIFGICLGHQLLSLACGAKTEKMKFGHHGANHPVQDLRNKQVFITSQNHGFAVDAGSLPEELEATHVSLFDGSLQGVRHKLKPALGFQGHPEASPGPHDISELFDDFIAMMEANA